MLTQLLLLLITANPNVYGEISPNIEDFPVFAFQDDYRYRGDIIRIPPTDPPTRYPYRYRCSWDREGDWMVVQIINSKGHIVSGFLLYDQNKPRVGQLYLVHPDQLFILIGTAQFFRRNLYILCPTRLQDKDKFKEIYEFVSEIGREEYGT